MPTAGERPQPLGPIAQRVLTELRKHRSRKVIDLAEVRQARIDVATQQSSLISPEKLAAYDPAHGIYIYAQNVLSALVENLAGLPTLGKLSQAYGDAEAEYLPSGPPMSPLSRSYFICWAMFDLCAGIRRETLASVAIAAGRSLGMEPALLEVLGRMQASRMGLWVHEGVSGGRVLLRELCTENRCEAVSGSGYQGMPGQIWYVRMMPPPSEVPGANHAVVFTSPYVLVEGGGGGRVVPARESAWRAYLERTLPQVPGATDQERYHHLMKFGLSRHYWNEYVFEAYVNYQVDMVLLEGFPDIPLSRPLSEESKARRGGLRNGPQAGA